MTRTSKRSSHSKRRVDKPNSGPTPAQREQANQRRRWFRFTVLIVAVAAVALLAISSMSRPIEVDAIEYELVRRYPHDPKAFTQGLIYERNRLYQSTGREGQSSIRILDLDGGENQVQPIDEEYFGEGITLWDDELIMLTWKDRRILFFDPEDLRLLREEEFPREAWGLTHDGRQLIMSDGSDMIRFLDPVTLEVVRTIDVKMDGRRLDEINELEYANDHIYANVWYKDYVVKISPRTGEVVGRIDFSELWPKSERPSRDAVLNGIAYDAENDRWFVTGKLWPELFEVRLKE